MSAAGRPKVAVIDYGMGNLLSVKRACEVTGVEAAVTSNPSVMMDSDGAILPGVGAFGYAMNNLVALNLVDPIKDFIKSGRSFMGICLGMQLLMSDSNEFGRHAGLDVIKGHVERFSGRDPLKKMKIPHVGWNRIALPLPDRRHLWDSSPLRRAENGEFMYFVHSYYAVPEDRDVVVSVTDYEGVRYCSSMLQENVFACQFHPEKSGSKGLEIYRNWAAGLQRGKGG